MADLLLTVAPSGFQLRFAGTRRVWRTLTGKASANIIRGSRTALALTFDTLQGESARQVAGVIGRLLSGNDRLVVPYAKIGYERAGTGGPFAAAQADVGAQSLTVSGTGTIEIGDIVQIGTAVHVAGSRYATSGDTLHIWPAIRESVAGGASVVVAAPQGIYELAGDQVPPVFNVVGRDTQRQWFGPQTLDLVEA